MTQDHRMQDHKMEDHELNIWREQWSSVAQPSSDFGRQVQQRINVQERHFLLGNVLTAVALAAMLIYAVFLSQQASRLQKEEATGVFVLVLVSFTCRLWFMRGTWRAETRSIRGFIELWHRRALAQIRRLQIAIYVAIGWLLFCAVLAVANWATIRLELTAHPIACLALTVFIAIMLQVIWFGAMWLRRRKLVELNEVKKLLEEIND
jgi:hypothetical protein